MVPTRFVSSVCLRPLLNVILNGVTRVLKDHSGLSKGYGAVYRFITANADILSEKCDKEEKLSDKGRDLNRKTHQTIKRVTENIEHNFHFNTAISAMMELFNALSSMVSKEDRATADSAVIKEAVTNLLILLSPMVPHFTAEMWEISDNSGSVEEQPWPEYDREAAKEEMLTIVIQVMGKVRSRLQVAAGTSDETLIEMALADENTIKFMAGKPVKKTIVVKKKLVNIVI